MQVIPKWIPRIEIIRTVFANVRVSSGTNAPDSVGEARLSFGCASACAPNPYPRRQDENPSIRISSIISCKNPSPAGGYGTTVPPDSACGRLATGPARSLPDPLRHSRRYRTAGTWKIRPGLVRCRSSKLLPHFSWSLNESIRQRINANSVAHQTYCYLETAGAVCPPI